MPPAVTENTILEGLGTDLHSSAVFDPATSARDEGLADGDRPDLVASRPDYDDQDETVAPAAKEAEAERFAQELNAIYRQPGSLAILRPKPAAEHAIRPKPLFQLREYILGLAMGTLPIPDGEFDTPITIAVRSDEVGIYITRGERYFWLRLPSENAVPDGEQVIFETAYGPLGKLGERCRASIGPVALDKDGDRAFFEFVFDPEQQTLQITTEGSPNRTLSFFAQAIALPDLGNLEIDPLDSVKVNPKAIRRLLPYVSGFIPQQESDPRYRSFYLAGDKFYGMSRGGDCLIELDQRIDLDVIISRKDQPFLGRGLGRLHTEATWFAARGSHHMFTDGLAGFAYAAPPGQRSAPSGAYDRHCLVSFDFDRDQLCNWTALLDHSPAFDRTIPVHIVFAADKISFEANHVRRRGANRPPSPMSLLYGDGYQFVPQSDPGAPSDLAATLSELGPLEITVRLDVFLDELSLTSGHRVRLDLLANKKGEPAGLLFDCTNDGLRYRASTPRIQVTPREEGGLRTKIRRPGRDAG